MQYKYSAKNNNGTIIKGIMAAEDPQDFFKKLEEEGLFCLEYKETKETEAKAKTIHRMRPKELVLFCRKLATMMAAGMTITSCFDVLTNTAENKGLAKLYLFIYEGIKGGKSLSGAMRDAGRSFPILLVNMVESGEESGTVDSICTRLAEYYERQNKIAGKIKVATTYPKLLMALAFVVIIILFTFVLPPIFEIFDGMELPPITKFMMAMSAFFSTYWYIAVAVFVILFIGSKYIFYIKPIKLFLDEVTIKLPKIGELVKKVYSSRFATTLAVLYSSGLSLVSGIRLSTNVVENAYIQQKLASVLETVSEGNSLSQSIAEINVFDKLLPSMISIGEETGSLDTVLNSVSQYYEQETESTIESLLAMLEPILLIVMALIIGSVLIAVMIPIFDTYGQIG